MVKELIFFGSLLLLNFLATSIEVSPTSPFDNFCSQFPRHYNSGYGCLSNESYVHCFKGISTSGKVAERCVEGTTCLNYNSTLLSKENPCVNQTELPTQHMPQEICRRAIEGKDPSEGFVCLTNDSFAYCGRNFSEISDFVQQCPLGTICIGNISNAFPYGYIHRGLGLSNDSQSQTIDIEFLQTLYKYQQNVSTQNPCLMLPTFLASANRSNTTFNATELCEGFNTSWYYCIPPADNTSAIPDRFGRCGVNISDQFCPTGTECTHILTQENPCTQSRIPRCGNGEIEDGEECETGGLGCNETNCMCMDGFQSLARRSCQVMPLANFTDVCGKIKKQYWGEKQDNDEKEFAVCVGLFDRLFLRCSVSQLGTTSNIDTCPIDKRCGSVEMDINPCF